MNAHLVRHLRAAFALTLPSLSCGWIAGEVAEQKVRQDAIEANAYDEDVAEVWTEARKLWREIDCELPEASKLDETFECEEGGKRWFRLTKSSDGHVTQFEIEERRVERDASGKETTTKARVRDWDLEWRLLERLDPDKASEVGKEAAAKGEKAKKATRDLIEAFE